MTEISTNEVNAIINKICLTEDMENDNDLDPKDHRFYKAISSNLNLIHILPKEETILKIITYSRNAK